MKIVLLSGASSIHTIRWANGLNKAGVEVHLISQHEPLETLDKGVHLHLFRNNGIIGYFTMVPKVRSLVKRINPDVLSAHYASGYATTASLIGFRPWMLSVWGSDVYDFPLKSVVHKKLVQWNLRKADRVASTSYCMAEKVRSLTPEVSSIAITPFGVDLKRYETVAPLSGKSSEEVTVGTVKVIDDKYGIDTLVKAFSLAFKRLQEMKGSPTLKLRIVGDGPKLDEIRTLIASEGLESNAKCIGRVPNTEIPKELEKLDIFVALSRLDSESFGVAIIEAGAAGRPVIVSDVGGLPEVTLDEQTGFVVERENPGEAADKIVELALNRSLRQRMGKNAIKHVTENYSWDESVRIMVSELKQTAALISKKKDI